MMGGMDAPAPRQACALLHKLNRPCNPHSATLTLFLSLSKHSPSTTTQSSTALSTAHHPHHLRGGSPDAIQPKPPGTLVAARSAPSFPLGPPSGDCPGEGTGSIASSFMLCCSLTSILGFRRRPIECFPSAENARKMAAGKAVVCLQHASCCLALDRPGCLSMLRCFASKPARTPCQET